MKSNLFLLSLAVLLVGCSQQRFVVMPAFTDVSHIEKLKVGMSKQEVSTALEINPIDFYYMQDGVDVFVYNYRLTEKRIPVTNDYTFIKDGNTMQNEHILGPAARNAGTPYYTELKKLYVSFKGDKVTAMITDSGKDDANAVLLHLASVQALTNDPQIKLVPRSTTDDNYVVPLDGKGEYITNSGTGTATGSGCCITGGPAEIAVLPKEEVVRGARVTEQFSLFRRGKKKQGYSRSISYKRD